jgi:hypothetical protein
MDRDRGLELMADRVGTDDYEDFTWSIHIHADGEGICLAIGEEGDIQHGVHVIDGYGLRAFALDLLAVAEESINLESEKRDAMWAPVSEYAKDHGLYHRPIETGELVYMITGDSYPETRMQPCQPNDEGAEPDFQRALREMRQAGWDDGLKLLVKDES